MNVLAVDQARNGAWSVFDYKNKALIGYGTFSFDTKKYTYARTILHIEELISCILKAYDVSAVFIEDIQLRANVQSFKKLAQLQGVLVNFCEKHDYLYYLIAPSRWQNFCKARGRNTNEKKNQTLTADQKNKKGSKVFSIQFVKDQFGVETENDNLADAILIAYYAINTVDLSELQKKHEKAE